MVKKNIYNVYDSVSESFLGDFLANNDKVAKNVFSSFLKKNESLNPDDLKLVHVSSFDSPNLSSDLSVLKEL